MFVWLLNDFCKSSAIKQKGESQGGDKKTKLAKFSENRAFLTP